MLQLDCNSLLFAPTAIGFCGKRSMKAHNRCEYDVRFRWSLRECDSVLAVSPNEGVVPANSIVSFQWTFTPCVEETFELSALLLCDGNDGQRRSHRVFFGGRAVNGRLTVRYCNNVFWCCILLRNCIASNRRQRRRTSFST